MIDNLSHNGKEPNMAEMAMLGDVFRFYGVGTVTPNISLEEIISGLVLEGDVASCAADMVGGLIVTSEIIAIMLADGEPLENLSTYVDKSIDFGKALCEAQEEAPNMLEKMARDICAHVMMTGGCTKCFRSELRNFLFDALDMSGKIERLVQNTLSLLSIVAMSGGEETMVGWSEALIARFEMLSLQYIDDPKASRFFEKSNSLSEAEYADKPKMQAALGEAVGCITTTMLLVNSGIIAQDSFSFLMRQDVDDRVEDAVSDKLFKNMSEETMTFLNKLGDKLDD